MSVDSDVDEIKQNVATIGRTQEEMLRVLHDIRKTLYDVNETLKEVRDGLPGS